MSLSLLFAGGWMPLAQAQDSKGLGRPDVPDARVSKVEEVKGLGAKKARGKVSRDKQVNDKQAARARSEQRAFWPRDGSATVKVSGAAASAAPGGLPITVAPAAGKDSLPVGTGVQLTVVDRKKTTAAGVNGVLLTAESVTAGRAEIGVRYGKLRAAVGNGWAQRLRLVQLPACALTSPGKVECRRQTLLKSENHTVGQTVTASVLLAGNSGSAAHLTSSSSSATVLALTGASAGEGQSPKGSGDYSATPLSESATWQAGASSGSFNWSYDFTMPPAAAGPAPSLSLAYSSGSVDGLTAATNNQGTAVGEGFALSESFIERTYVDCSEDGHEGIHDQCWKYDNAKLVLNGKASLLVKDETSGQWRLQDDDGSKVTRSTGADNIDDNGEYWTVVTGEGTKYVFGLDKLDGATDQRTNSTWTVPVFGDDSGEPGYNQGDSFGDRWVKQAWRWNLDYVEDTSGNAATYWYAKEGNHYKKNKSATANAAYDRGGYLKEIKYGLRKNELFTDQADAKVVFGYDERCTASDCGQLTKDTADNWPDVPFDAICSSGDKECLAVGPSYFSRKRLTKIDTYSSSAVSGSYDSVDSWSLIQRYLDGGDIGDTSDQVLTLESIKRTAKAGTAIELEPVSFTYQMRPNRVDGTDDILPLTRPRISTITSETGAITTVTLSGTECTRSQVSGAAEDTNTRNCFPQYWHINGAENASVDWFHKYRVLAVTVSDPAGQNDTVEHEYTYSGAAWNYSDDPLIPKDERTWSDWRGYREVTTYNGAKNTTRSKTVSLYMQGMDGDKMKDGATRSVSITPLATPALGLGTIKDSDQYAGHLRQKVVYSGATAISATSSEPWSSETARQNAPDAADHVARYVRTAEDTTHTYLTGTGTWRTRTTISKYDDYGMVYQAEDKGDDARNGDETCTRTWYARNAEAGLVSLTSRERVVGRACSVADADLSLPAASSARGDVLSDTATAYDGVTWSTSMTPVKGLKTWTGRVKGHTGTTPSWQTVQSTAYDTLGRVTSVTDAKGNKTTTTYTPAAAGPLTKKVVTNVSKGHSTTSFLDPRRGMELRVYDANLKKTELAYDALGRLTDVWLPNRNRAADFSPNQKFDYGLSSTKQSWVSSASLKADGETYNTSYTIYDSLLRELQEQSPSPQGGRVLTDTRYDSRGLAYEKYEEIFDNASVPNSTYTRAEYGEAPKQTETVYDGAERAISSTLYVFGARKWSTTTSYTGNSTATSALQGGSATRTITDARGRETEKREYTGTSPADAEFGGGVGAPYSATKFQHTLDDKERTVTGPDGAAWAYGFDLFGRQNSVTDPDKGTSKMEHDVLDQLTKSTDARGKSIVTEYDELGRVTGTWDGVKDDAHQLTARTYDSVLKGQPASSTRYVGGKNGSAYTQTVTGYDTLDRPTTTTLTLPSADPLSGGTSRTIEFTSSYRLDGTLGSNKEPALGGLASEVLEYAYTPLGQVKSITGATGYLLNADYSAVGRAQQYTLGTANTDEHKKVYVNNQFEAGTGRLTRSFVTDQTHPYMLMDLNYTFDQAGNVTAIADPTTLGGTSTAETQCFGYDGNRRLVQAWTPASQQCSDTPSASSLSGPAPYWTDYKYNNAGQRATEIQHATAGDTTTTYCYEEGRPHTLSGTSKSANCITPDTAYAYDTSGNTTKRPGGSAAQSLAWSSEGRLDQLTENGKKTDYLYDADGELLIRSTENGERVLYTGKTELHLRTDGTTWAQRTYSSGSLNIALRTNQAGNNKLYYLAGDHQGTQTLSVSAGSTQEFTKRRTTPFGAERGKAEGGNWPDDKGFLGKTKDTTTGLTHLDAREYDPKIGQFISVDPVMETDDSQSLNGYSYAANNPVTTSDPTGRTRCDVDPVFCNHKPNPGPAAPCPSLTNPQCPEYGGGGKGGGGGHGGGGKGNGGGGRGGHGGGGGGGAGPVIYGPPSCGAPPLAACSPVGPPAQPPLLMGPDPAPILSFSANCGIESDWNYICNAGNGLMTSGTYLQEGFNRSGQITTQASYNLRNHPDPQARSKAGKTLRSLQTHPGVQRVAAAGRADLAQMAGKGLLIGGFGFTAWSNYNSTGGDIPLTATETVVDTYVVLGATKVGATLGASIGTAFGPAGTIIGGGIGGAAGAVTGILLTGPVNNAMTRGWKSVKGWFN